MCFKEEVRTFEYFIKDQGGLERETAELVTWIVDTVEWIDNKTEIGRTTIRLGRGI